MLLDSTFLHDLIRADAAATETLEELIAAEVPVALSPLTIYEVGVGLRGDAAGFRGQFWSVVDDIETVPLGRGQADRALAIQRELYDQGEPIGAVDVLLAGTAATLSDARILTRNVDEFRRVDAVGVETY